jgi:hypothetical protein
MLMAKRELAKDSRALAQAKLKYSCYLTQQDHESPTYDVTKPIFYGCAWKSHF